MPAIPRDPIAVPSSARAACSGAGPLALGFFALIQFIAGAGCATGKAPSCDPEKWEPDIRAFEKADELNPPSPGVVVFTGSSSIRLWKSLADDFAGYRVVNRGFGGSTIADVTRFADRIISPHHPSAIVLYAGDNDIAAGKSPLEVRDDFLRFLAAVRAPRPRVPVLFISIKPSPSRWRWIREVREANRLIRELCDPKEGLIYVDVFSPMLGADGMPRSGLFLEDHLHLNGTGYELWRERVGESLRQALLLEQ